MPPSSSSMQKGGGSSYGAYGIAKNNKMSDVSTPNSFDCHSEPRQTQTTPNHSDFVEQSGRQIVGAEDRVVSRGQNGRAIINGRKDDQINSSTTGTQIRSKNFQQYAFGDNYGNTRQFEKPDEDELQKARDHTTLLRKGHSTHQDVKSTSIR